MPDLSGKKVAFFGFTGSADYGALLSHTAKSKSDEAYERVMDILREIAFMWHQDGF